MMTIFSYDAEKFSSAFKSELSGQLSSSLYHLLGVKEDKVRPRFALFVGEFDLKIQTRDGYAFCPVRVNTFTYCYDMTIYWKVSNQDDLLSVVAQDGITSRDIEFGWCNDFAKDGLLSSLSNKKSLSKKKYNLSFEVEYDYSKYPDLSVTYYFNTLPESNEILELEDIFRERLSGCYMSEIILQNNTFLSGIDFQNISYKAGIKQLMSVLQNLNTLELAKKISKIVIE